MQLASYVLIARQVIDVSEGWVKNQERWSYPSSRMSP